jgi:hypothetical protein
VNVGYEKQVNIENEKSFFFQKFVFYIFLEEEKRRKELKVIEEEP